MMTFPKGGASASFSTPGRMYHTNATYRRERLLTHSPSAITARDLSRAPPFVAVLAFFRSMGYIAKRWQAARWKRYCRTWCAFTVEKGGEAHVRWVRAGADNKLEISDGTDVPREQKLRYAIARSRAWNRKWESKLGAYGA